jgi:hypothetical protein
LAWGGNMTETIDLYIVIDTETRVIKTVTLNPNVMTGIKDTLVRIPDQIKIYTVSDANTGTNTYWKNVNDIKVPATKKEIEAMSWAAIELPDGTRQYWMLDVNNKKVPANNTDIDALGIDPERERIKREQKQQMYKDATTKLAIDDTLPKDLKNFFVALLETL